jgi:hypothetical protein
MDFPQHLSGLRVLHREIEKSLGEMLANIRCEIPFSVRVFGFSDTSECYLFPSQQIPGPVFKSFDRDVKEENKRRQIELDPDPMKQMMYGSMDATVDAIAATFVKSKLGRNRKAFVSWPKKRDDHLVCAVVLVDESAYAEHSVLTEKEGFERRGVPPSLPTAIIESLFESVDGWLEVPDNGQRTKPVHFDATEIARRAGARFLRVGAHAGGFGSYIQLSKAGNFELFEVLTAISFMSYEQKEGQGGFIIANKDRSGLDIEVELAIPIKVTDHRAVRKLLEVSSKNRQLLSDGIHVFGIGEIKKDYDESKNDTFLVEFIARGTWELKHAGKGLMRVVNGQPQIPVKPIEPRKLASMLLNEFGATKEANKIAEMVRTVAESHHGAVIVISTEAAYETVRLKADCTPITPIPATADLLIALTKIDGAVMLDPAGLVHSFGLILDGAAASGGSSSRGARYNSANRYQKFVEKHGKAIVVVISEDGMVDVFPREEKSNAHELSPDL